MSGQPTKSGRLVSAHGRLTLEYSPRAGEVDPEVIEYRFGPEVSKKTGRRKRLDRRRLVEQIEDAAQALKSHARCIRGQLDREETEEAFRDGP